MRTKLKQHVLDLLEASYEMAASEIVSSVQFRGQATEKEVLDAMIELVADRWVYKVPGSIYYRKRTDKQREQLLAEQEGKQATFL